MTGDEMGERDGARLKQPASTSRPLRSPGEGPEQELGEVEGRPRQSGDGESFKWPLSFPSGLSDGSSSRSAGCSG